MSDAKTRLGRIDFQRLFADYYNLAVFKGAFDRVGLPTLTVKWIDKQGSMSGTCSMKGVNSAANVEPGNPEKRSHVILRLYKDARVADVIQTTLHELTHAAGWMDHSHRFYNALREAVNEAHGVDCNEPWVRVYEYDQKQRDALDAVFGDDLSSLPLLPKGQVYKNPKQPRAPKRRAPAMVVDVGVDDCLAALKSTGLPVNDPFADL